MDETPQTSAPATDAPARSFTHTVERKAGSLAALTVEVDADRLSRATDRVFGRRVRQAKIPGFRPGKAPRAIYERTYGAEHLWAEAAEDVIDETYREIVQVERLEPLEQPEVDITKFEPGQPLAYTATVPIRPEVTLADYGTPPAIEITEITDEEVGKTIDRMRDEQAVLQPVEREAKDGDVITIDVDVDVEGQPQRNFGRNAHLELGSERPFPIPGFTEGLVGIRAGEKRALDLTFPDTYGDEALRAKPATFTVTASQVSERVLPALDDEFAKGAGVADVGALDRAVRGEMAHAAFHLARDKAADQLLDTLIAGSTMDLPEVLVRQELDHLVLDLKGRVEQRGVPWEQFLLEARKTEDEIRTEFGDAAGKRAKSLLILDTLAEKEQITVSGEELAQEVAMTPLAQQDARALRDPRVLSSLARSMRNRKVMDHLLGLAGPDAEREYLKAAGAPDTDFHEAPPELVVPEAHPQASTEGREALRQMLEKNT